MRKKLFLVISVIIFLILGFLGYYAWSNGYTSLLGRYSGQSPTNDIRLEAISEIQGMTVLIQPEKFVFLLERAGLWPLIGREGFIFQDGVFSRYQVGSNLQKIVFRLRPISQIDADRQNPEYSNRLSMAISNGSEIEINYTRLKPIEDGRIIELLVYLNNGWTIDFGQKALLDINITRILVEEVAVAFYNQPAGSKTPPQQVREALGDNHGPAVEVKIN